MILIFLLALLVMILLMVKSEDATPSFYGDMIPILFAPSMFVVWHFYKARQEYLNYDSELSFYKDKLLEKEENLSKAFDEVYSLYPEINDILIRLNEIENKFKIKMI